MGHGARAAPHRAGRAHHRSLPALRAYLEGEREYTAGRSPTAVDAFQRAVAADSEFALAYYRLSSALSWTSSPIVTPATRRARELIGRLSRRDSLLVEARFASSTGFPEQAEQVPGTSWPTIRTRWRRG